MQDVKDYTGRLFIEVETQDVFGDVNLVRMLNENSSRIVNKVQGYTHWEMSDLGAALKAVLLLQEKHYPFRLTGEENILFMEVLRD